MSGSLLLSAETIATIATQEPTGGQDPTLVWTCPEHREVTEGEAGECHLCQRQLIQTLVVEAWSCPIHAVISQQVPGTCPICRRELRLISEELTYACPMHSEVSAVEPGTCKICRMALEPTTSTRPHQDHNPKHGGMFFMAPDNWHHLEGAYPDDGLFRVYLYDNFSQPMDAAPFRGRAVLKEGYDRETRQTRELQAYPLLVSEDGAFLEARVGSSRLPRAIIAKVRFEPDGPFERFDFIFGDLSVDEEVDAPATVATSELVIPERPEDIVAEISRRNDEVGKLVSQGAMDRIYLPALQAKDLAVALESHLAELPVDRQGTLQWALKELVRTAWLLDDYGDLGNKEKVDSAYALFDRAAAEIVRVYE